MLSSTLTLAPKQLRLGRGARRRPRHTLLALWLAAVAAWSTLQFVAGLVRQPTACGNHSLVCHHLRGPRMGLRRVTQPTAGYGYRCGSPERK